MTEDFAHNFPTILNMPEKLTHHILSNFDTFAKYLFIRALMLSDKHMGE